MLGTDWSFYSHLPDCRLCGRCRVHMCFHIHVYRDGRECWVDVRYPACGWKGKEKPPVETEGFPSRSGIG